MSNLNIPTFAVLGHPNEGKSSVVSTLVEDDRISISATPGETRRTSQFSISIDGRELVRFIDTPGFQHANKILKWFMAYRERTGSVDGVLAAFVGEHRQLEQFQHDIELMQPLMDGAAVIFVVDTSHPLKNHDRNEMEILRLIGAPRLALINKKADNNGYLQDWKNELNRHYNIIREFNAHRALFDERIKLLESLRAMHQDWEAPLADAIDLLRQNWDMRLHEAADVICEMLRKVCVHKESVRLRPSQSKADVLKKAMQVYEGYISEEEDRSHRAIRRLFRHSRFSAELESAALFGENDLFSDTVWKVLGLTRWQIAVLGAITGGSAGALVDASLPGITFGVFMAGGAIVGGSAFAWGANRVADVNLVGHKLGGEQVEVGPVSKSSQLIAVLIDRCLLYFQAVSSQPHAVRRLDVLRIAMQSYPWLTSGWSKGEQKTMLKYVRAARGASGGRKASDWQEKLAGILVKKMRQACAG